MPVVALSSHNLHREPRQSLPHLPSLSSPRLGATLDLTEPAPAPADVPTPAKSQSLEPGNNDLGIAFQPPTPVSIPTNTQSQDDQSPQTEAGPSTGSGSRAIPPPPNPRRHRSGILMSRMRALSGGHPGSRDLGMTLSKSYGDLSMISAAGQLATPDDEKDEEEVLGSEHGHREWKRATSESLAAPDDELTMWDNSARFYHHIHSRPASRTGSRATSPARSPSISSVSNDIQSSPKQSPIFVRRSVNLQPMTDALPPHSSQQAVTSALSPHQTFLHSHLPPTFPESLHSSGLLVPDNRPHSMVILTPTTQEWRELKELRRLEIGDDDLRDEDDSSDSGQLSRRNSLKMDGSLLRRTLSADYLGEEKHHQRDPGASPERPTVPVPLSPKTPGNTTLSTHPSMEEVDPDQPLVITTDEESPIRFNSIGKRPSLTVIRGIERPTVARAKTKREREREKLFKDLDGQLEADRMSDSDSRADSGRNGGVQEIGLGSLGSRPSSSGSLAESPTGTRDSLAKTTSQDGLSSSHVSPSQPLRPSPLHAYPLTADMNRSSSGSGDGESSGNPLVDTPSSLAPTTNIQSPSPNSQAHNLETIRDYARSLVSPRPRLPNVIRSGQSTPSPPPGSPRPSRRRDTAHRISLVAGRVVQPFAVPSSTALPAGHVPAPAPHLQSFSPFRSPNLGPSTPKGLFPPTFSRLDSNISLAPSIGAPSECGTPTSETAGGLGGRGIDDYVILKEAGKGAYGLVMRAKVKGPKGEPVGDEVIIKYIIKARILADCWKKHKVLGPIPVEIHVMDQLRHLLYNPPIRPHPWDPTRERKDPPTPMRTPNPDLDDSLPNTPESPGSESSSSFGVYSPAQRHIASEIKHLPERGHPNIAKLLDFFEDKEFYYLVMPRFGTGLDLFDRVENSPDGLSPFEIRSLIGQLADAIRFLHSNGIVHRDIKDENVILDGHGRCQLIDFGSAAHWRPGKRWDTFSGTLHYASPEILRGEMYGGKEQDVWALGVVGYVLLVGETPFSELPDEVLQGLSNSSNAEAALSTRCANDEEEGLEADGGGRLADAADLVRQCLAMELANRPSAEVVCQHRYLRGEGGWTGKRGWVAMGWK
ncbi:hypothetical protein BD324DRAFT_648793 [Kockovaella imperatae]|uniref:Protein kinase domain-containing protein n=1 Tax=Kockovaella imperatae TaxID=4999 RepID=A0A1Y1UQ90_9TREE|nr:hypothetical protein BD324DRAFT_648793 [Kockovaella imperatae]ORX40193.1 hypothetical protein BD324DRAFT_648793 [Kockovaella imperatae]